MTDSLLDSDGIDSTAFSQKGLHAISSWLDAPPPINTTDDLLPLLSHLATLRASRVTPEQRASMLERLYLRSISVLTTLLPALSSVALPIPITRKTRQLIRSLQDLLRTLAEDLLAAPNRDDGEQAPNQRQISGLTLWRSLYALAQHLLISNLAASPAGIGIWQQLHQTYDTAHRLDLVSHTPEGASGTLQNIYFSAILLACAQPASFTSREVDFVAAYLERFADRIDSTPSTSSKAPAVFWIDPARDAAAFACSRKSAPPETSVLYFSCARLAALLREQLAALEAGDTPRQINLPDFAGTPAGRGVLRRLITYWGEPGKRRFPRRRQNYRSVLCVGLDSLWRLFQEGDEAGIETSSWMITNESPDGYAVMHVSGKTVGMSVGDVTAMRTESGENWQICIVRWALSENQEHIELGLQILATRAVPAFLAQPAEASNSGHLSVLILPEIQALRATEMLVVPSGALDNQPGKLILVVEKENIEIREMKSIHLDEQNSQIEVFSNEPDSLSV
ncbi:MAG: hypothetical protein IPJ48_08840 [Propionivibrio sp.]|uniref:Uncharacterized protein n=1 Tax=Candidatus Propionivibrio dominans TaxID=2954373 RepID=A0A9D7IH93_9RHOO|nr:hypothetical protein [Candidatus Propionivibrio dominans]